MKKEEVPQDGDNMHEGKFKQLFYATDDAGAYVKVNSVGWEPENIAMQQAWEEVNTKIEDARKRMEAGEVSPILYYMEKTIMDLPLLASYVNKFQWQVKRHLKPSVFRKLSDDTLRKYAAAFKISLEELKKAGQ
jgi:Ni,Fe-hydrogenase maturation factor